MPINPNSEYYSASDNISINIAFENGSVANIVYTSMGSKSFPKEKVTVFCNGSVGEINNFVSATIYKSEKKKLKKIKKRIKKRVAPKRKLAKKRITKKPVKRVKKRVIKPKRKVVKKTAKKRVTPKRKTTKKRVVRKRKK